MLIHIVMQKCDEGTRRKWKESLNFKRLPCWNDCSAVLERHCQYLQSLDKTSPCVSDVHTNDKLSKIKKSHKDYAFSCTKSSCIFCSSANHKLNGCERFKSLSTAQRFDTVKRFTLCINCLSKGQQRSNCPSTYRCKICSDQHHTLLHRSNTFNATTPFNSVHPTPQSSMVSAVATTSRDAVMHTHLEKSSTSNVILATALVLIQDASGCYQLGRALLDSCSQVNFITNDFAQKLRIPMAKHNIEINNIGNSSTRITSKVSTTIKSRFTAFQLPLTFCITSHIAYQPDSEINISTWNVPSNINLADEQFYKSTRIDLLLGTESFFSVLSVGQIKLGLGLPTLQKTILGWIVSGRYDVSQCVNNSTCLLSSIDSVEEKLECLWKLEEVSITPHAWTSEQQVCDRLFSETVCRTDAGRVMVRLPFKDNPQCLGSSYGTALHRFITQENQLSRSPELKTQYVAFMEEYQNLRHMIEEKDPNIDKPHYYIPHHCVLKPISTSTKLRVVFDASCRTSSQKSLNDILMIGPTLQTELFILLLRFRLFRFALTADIVNMYWQILIDPEDRKFQCILWRSSPSTNIHSLSELHQIRHELEELLKQGGFELANWHSNHQAFRDDTTVKDLNIGSDVIICTLGLKWDQDNDVFIPSFNVKSNSISRITKRTILSIASSLFDPLGLLAPITISTKTLLQELWLLKFDWDESIPQNLHSAWERLCHDLSSLNTITIPRYCLKPKAKTIQLHGFCDASIRAYGCSIYIRVTDDSNLIEVQLFVAKSRVAPLKKQSLPKLELCEALLLARLYNKIKSLFEKFDTDVYL
ncbi:uncharacterized protein LOC119675401 [Teleopsis dalmanni]|uniref:uncharacterized protein LOC119675401 n=1 Tax=Teleopsis dalmanni TaxID=139649 RepID=UPI0018CED70B|nr:uncharacterized protein LOC119675401 [Teleopsis dalmanni]